MSGFQRLLKEKELIKELLTFPKVHGVAEQDCSLTLPQGYKKCFMLNSTQYEIVGILTFTSRINKISECFKKKNFIIFQYFNFYEQLKFHAQLS